MWAYFEKDRFNGVSSGTSVPQSGFLRATVEYSARKTAIERRSDLSPGVAGLNALGEVERFAGFFHGFSLLERRESVLEQVKEQLPKGRSYRVVIDNVGAPDETVTVNEGSDSLALLSPLHEGSDDVVEGTASRVAPEAVVVTSPSGRTTTVQVTHYQAAQAQATRDREPGGSRANREYMEHHSRDLPADARLDRGYRDQLGGGKTWA